MDTVGPVVVAVTTEDDRYPRSRQIAMELARHADARLVLYDWDAATVLGDPNPTVWSADGPDHEPPTELGIADLEAAGRDAIASQVAEARRRGVETAAWLPSEPGADALGAFVADRGATTVVLPEDLHAKGRSSGCSGARGPGGGHPQAVARAGRRGAATDRRLTAPGGASRRTSAERDPRPRP